MANEKLMEAGARLAAHLRTLGVGNPVVGAGSSNLFIYAVKRDKARVQGISEWEGVPVKVSIAGPFRPLTA